MVKNIFWIILFFLSLFIISPVQAQTYYTVQEALKYLYPNADKIDFEKKKLSNAQIATIKQNLKLRGVREEWTIYRAWSKDKIDGYAIIDSVLGKELPITYIVSLSPEGVINEVEIMVYRESHGSQIKNKAFRKQFVGKTTQSDLTVGRDIINISGATISVRNVSLGVKTVLAVWNALYK